MRDAGLCWKCKCPVLIPDELYAAAKRSSKVVFFCAYGHEAVFKEGETDLDKMRRERDRLAQCVAEKNDEIERQKEYRRETERQLSATRGVVTRIKNRVSKGVCPCCNRSFGNLARHMLNEHPDFTATEAAE